VSKRFLKCLTLRNVHFSDDCALIASNSAQVYRLYNISLYSVSPSAMSWRFCIAPVLFDKGLISHQLSLLYRGAAREYLSPASCHNILCLPVPPCHSSLLPFTSLTAIPQGASLYQFPTGLQEPCKRQSGMLWF